MFDLSGDNPQRIQDMYDKYKGDSRNPCTDDVLDLIGMFTMEVPKNYSHPTMVEFCCDVANNICTGRWTMLPTMWAQHASAYPDLRLTDAEQVAACNRVSKECDNMSRELQLPRNTPNAVRHLALHWIRAGEGGFQNTGFQSMLMAAKVFVDLNSLFE